MLKEITQDQFGILLNNNIPIYNESIEIDGEIKILQKVELREYAKYFKITDLEKLDLEKNLIITEVKDLGKQGEELRSKYLSAELLPDSELKTETLRILKEKGDIVMDQYIKKQNILIEKYGIEILQEII